MNILKFIYQYIYESFKRRKTSCMGSILSVQLHTRQKPSRILHIGPWSIRFYKEADHVNTTWLTYVFERYPAAGWVGGVAGVPQSFHGGHDGGAVGLLKPRFVRRFGPNDCDAANVIQRENHGPHQRRVLVAHDGNLLVPSRGNYNIQIWPNQMFIHWESTLFILFTLY